MLFAMTLTAVVNWNMVTLIGCPLIQELSNNVQIELNYKWPAVYATEI